MIKDIRLLKPTLYNFELFSKRSKEIFDSGNFTNNGPFVKKFEQDVQSYIGSPTIALANGTLALILTLKNLGIIGKVIVPSFTFCATAHALKWAGLEPVFVDIDKETFNLDPKKVKEAITPEVKAILAVHVFGNPCDINELEKIAKEHNLKLIFDSSHAFGSSYHGQKIGNFGFAEIFSTHATKPFMSVEGGLVTTKDEILLSLIQKERNFGIEDVIDTTSIGINAKMSELHAIVGLDSLANFQNNLIKRKEIVDFYKNKLKDIPGISFQKIEEDVQSSYFFFSIIINPREYGLNRDELAKELEKVGVQTRKYFYLPLHKQKSYQNYSSNLPNTEFIAENILCLPTHLGLSIEDIQYITDTIKKNKKDQNYITPKINILNHEKCVIKNNLIKRVLITGGAGYVGTVLIEKLLEKGYYVRILDSLIFGKDPLSNFLSNHNFDLHIGLVEDKYIVEKCLEDIDYVIHLSGLSNDPSCEIDSNLTKKSNFDATEVLLDLAKKKGIKRFIYASSCSVYGFTEGEIVNENSPLNPLTAYAKSKVDCENLIISSTTQEFNTVCLRKATIYGPSYRQRFDLVINTMTGMALSEKKIIINGGEQWRPFVHVSDVADAYIFMLEADSEKINGKIFNIGSNDQNLKIVDIAKKIAKLLPDVSVEISDSPDKRSYRVNFDKVNALGWKATQTIEDGVIGVKKLFDEKKVKDFRDINYFNIKRMISYLNI